MYLKHTDLWIQAISRSDFFFSSSNQACIHGSTVPLIHRAEGVVHWFQVELMTTQLRSATCKTELLEKCWNIYQYSWFFTQLSILICNLFKPQAVLALVTEVFSNWLKFWSQVHKNRNNSWSLSHKCGFWESNPTWRPRFKVQIFHKFQLWGLVMKKKPTTSVDQSVGLTPLLIPFLFLISLPAEHRNLNLKGSCKTHAFSWTVILTFNLQWYQKSKLLQETHQSTYMYLRTASSFDYSRLNLCLHFALS